jgi:hypothetical protein
MFFLKRNLPTWERAARIIGGVAIGAAVASGLTTYRCYPGLHRVCRFLSGMRYGGTPLP